MRPAHLLLFLLLCATASAQPARPPAFNPAQDAPHTVGQPGHVDSMRLPPEPRPARVLPETPETRRGPGIWAETPPRAAQHAIPLLQILLLLPTDASEFEEATVDDCKVSMEQAGGRLLKTLMSLDPLPRACAVALLYRHCIDGVRRVASRLKARGTEYDAVAFRAFDRIADAAKKMEGFACKERPNEKTRDAVKEITTQWSAIHE